MTWWGFLHIAARWVARWQCVETAARSSGECDDSAAVFLTRNETHADNVCVYDFGRYFVHHLAVNAGGVPSDCNVVILAPQSNVHCSLM